MVANKTPGFIDLFCGCGGLSLGFLQAGFRPLIAVDNDPKAVQCYNQNLSSRYGAKAITFDLKAIQSVADVTRFLDRFSVDYSTCSIIIGGPPCQSFSVVGRNKIRNLMSTDNDRRTYWQTKDRNRTTLFQVYAYFLEAIGPRSFLFENVPTITSHPYFKRIIERFRKLEDDQGNKLDYEFEYDKYLASVYGVPQERKRLFLVGRQKDPTRGLWKRPRCRPMVTVREALDDLPRVQVGATNREVRYHAPATSPYQRLMRSAKNGSRRGVAYDHICRWHNPDDIALFARMSHGARFADPDVQASLRTINPEHKLLKYSVDKFKDKLHKLDPNRPAWTVTAHLQKDCYKFIHYEQPRTVTVREAARLQSFPDWFRFDSISMVSSFGLIGNAVPPLLAQRFAESITSDRCGLTGDGRGRWVEQLSRRPDKPYVRKLGTEVGLRAVPPCPVVIKVTS